MSLNVYVGFFLILFWICGAPPSSHAHVSMQCVQTGAGLTHVPHYTDVKKWTQRLGPFSLGALRFDSTYGGAIDSRGWATHKTSPIGPWDVFRNGGWEKPECPYNWHHLAGTDVLLCDQDDSRVKLRITAVQQTDASGKTQTLAGWLHIEVELVDPEDSIRQLYVQMYDRFFNAIGEFVTDSSEQCEASDPDKFVSPTAYQYLPCSAIGAREAKPSQALYMVHSGDLIDKSLNGSKYLPKEELSRGVHFTWRMNEYWCNRHARIIPIFFILTTKNIDSWHQTTGSGNWHDPNFWSFPRLGWWKLYRKTYNYWLLPDWYGAADIKHPQRGPLQCHNPVFNGTGFNQSLSGEAPWIREKKQHVVTDEYYYASHEYRVGYLHGPNGQVYGIYGVQTCQQNPYFDPNYAHFSGRCSGIKSHHTSHNYHQTCNTNANAEEFRGLNLTELNFKPYKNYTNDLFAIRSANCNNSCQAPETEEDVVDIAKLPDPKRNGTERVLVEQSHKYRSKDSVAKFWRGRKFHGILCIICTMFVTPVSLFVARYFKETGMKCVFAGLPIWCWIHVANSLGLFGIYYSSQTAIRPSISSWGHSENAFAMVHYKLGWISHGIFTLFLVFGGVRGGTHGRAVAVRKMIMASST